MKPKVHRSHFLELAAMVAGSTQKSYGALDSFAEQNGREQAKRLREYCDELDGLLGTLAAQPRLLPIDASERASHLSEVQSVQKWAAAMKLRVEHTELFIKRGMPSHLPSCADPEAADGVPTCPEHCRACAFGTSAGDGSRVAACTRVHTHRCSQCASVHALHDEFEVLIKAARRLVEKAVEVEAEAVAGGGDGEQAAAAAGEAQGECMACDGEAPTFEGTITFKDLVIAIQRALLRLKAFHAHERRAAHEAKVLEMLLHELKEDGCIVVADWKVRCRWARTGLTRKPPEGGGSQAAAITPSLRESALPCC